MHEYVVQALKILGNLAHAETHARCPKTGHYALPKFKLDFFS